MKLWRWLALLLIPALALAQGGPNQNGGVTGNLNTGGGGTLPTCVVNQLVYYAGNGNTVSCLTLGTGLSITTGVINAAGGGMVYPGAGIPISIGSAWSTSITPGTGVQTALGVNVGTAGAFVVNGGALGTPSSGVGTNLTGTATALNIGGTAANLSGTPALPNGTTATTQTVADNTTKIATDAFVLANAGGSATSITPGTTTIVGATAPCLIDNSASTTMGCVTVSSSVIADLQASTTFTVAGTGCTPSAHTGGPFAGEVTLAATCTAIVITFNGATGFTAPNGWHCNVGDKTLQAAGTWFGEWLQSAYTTTTATLPIPSAAGTTDVISFDCQYF